MSLDETAFSQQIHIGILFDWKTKREFNMNKYNISSCHPFKEQHNEWLNETINVPAKINVTIA